MVKTKIAKNRIAFLAAVSLFNHFAISPLFAALASPSAQVLDSSGAPRTSFSSTERIGFSMKVQNTTAGASPIQFSFEVRDPSGARRLFQSGNAAPGSSVGFTGSSLQGISVGQIYTTPGLYTLVAKATSGVETVEATASFTVLSPAITLSYPPNNARDLIDQPLVFRWVSSGATKYRIFVDDDSSFYNTLFTGETVANFFSYPQNPPDIRQRLAAGQAYYWKVEGLDFAGNVLAKTDVPFSFTVKSQAAQATSKDLAIVGLEKVNEAVPGAQGALPMAVFVKNQGGRAELNIPVNLFADGAAVPTSPKRLNQIDAGHTERIVFPVRPPDEGKVLVLNAFLDFFDDNLQNNSMSKQIRGEEPRERRARLRPNEMWDILRSYVNDPAVLGELEGYAVAEVEGEGMSAAELSDLLLAVKDNRAHVTAARLKPAE